MINQPANLSINQQPVNQSTNELMNHSTDMTTPLSLQEGMIDVTNKKCAHGSCAKRPTYGLKDQKRPTYCAEHATPGMVDVINRTCQHPDCFKQSLYGPVGSRTPMYCAEHAPGEMINLLTRR